MKRLILAVALSAMLAACGSSPTKEQEGAAVEGRRQRIAIGHGFRPGQATRQFVPFGSESRQGL